MRRVLYQVVKIFRAPSPLIVSTYLHNHIRLFSTAPVCHIMMSFLLLPLEIRRMIYHELRLYQSPMIPPGVKENQKIGYCSYGFNGSILATNRQIFAEAREVFYSENHWTFFVGWNVPFDSACFLLSPLACWDSHWPSALSLMRKVHIRFHLFDRLMEALAGDRYKHIKQLHEQVNEIANMLRGAAYLHFVNLIWTETTRATAARDPLLYYHSGASTVDDVIWIMTLILKPLTVLPTSIPLQKSMIKVVFRDEVPARRVVTAFSQAVDNIIAEQRANPARTIFQNPSRGLLFHERISADQQYRSPTLVSKEQHHNCESQSKSMPNHNVSMQPCDTLPWRLAATGPIDNDESDLSGPSFNPMLTLY